MLTWLILSATCPLICSALSWALFPTMADMCATSLASVRRPMAGADEPALSFEERLERLTSLP